MKVWLSLPGQKKKQLQNKKKRKKKKPTNPTALN